MEGRQGLRITTWNVNGIKNPFGYQPWRSQRTFAAMFEILEADIVVMQETKIQRKDLQDDMVLVPGWDVFFSLPKHKKGYSGVAVYTRNSVCAPTRAEEGITGILTPPNSSTSFWDLPKDQQIGGYPTPLQLAECPLDVATLDSEGRCVVLEFPAFVLIGVYCPANRDETRDDFRIGFINALDARVRNLVAAGKRVFLTGDLNIIREEMDTANAEEQLKKHGMTRQQYVSTPARRMLNQLLLGGKVFGERDEGREKPVMVDICRSFHPDRPGMFTCWEQKINARPGNFGSRIDYVMCSQDWTGWFCESNIQEGLVGSDHCPVYAVLKQKVDIGGEEVDIRDVMSTGMFKGGFRQREWSTKDLLHLSAKLIPEFDRRRNIRDMFAKKPSLKTGQSSFSTKSTAEGQTGTQTGSAVDSEKISPLTVDSQVPSASRATSFTSESQSTTMPSPAKPSVKRASDSSSAAARPHKKGKFGATSKTTASAKDQAGKGQSSLMGFFKPKVSQSNGTLDGQSTSTSAADGESDTASMSASDPPTPALPVSEFTTPPVVSDQEYTSPSKTFNLASQKSVIDPVASKESWSKILGKRTVPRCEHNEPCISLITKKLGENQGHRVIQEAGGDAALSEAYNCGHVPRNPSLSDPRNIYVLLMPSRLKAEPMAEVEEPASLETPWLWSSPDTAYITMYEAEL